MGNQKLINRKKPKKCQKLSPNTSQSKIKHLCLNICLYKNLLLKNNLLPKIYKTTMSKMSKMSNANQNLHASQTKTDFQPMTEIQNAPTVGSRVHAASLPGPQIFNKSPMATKNLGQSTKVTVCSHVTEPSGTKNLQIAQNNENLCPQMVANDAAQNPGSKSLM